MHFVFDNLKEAVENPNNIVARQNMHDASFMAGLAFNNAWLGIVHSLSHQVGALYGIPHGASNAIFLPNVIRYNAQATNRFPDLARVIGKETAEDLAQAIETLRSEVNNQSAIKEFGISREDWDKNLDYIANNALVDPCTGFNPRVPTLDELKAKYRKELEAAKEVAFDDAVEAAAIELAVENAEIVDLPSEMVHEEVHRSMNEFFNGMQQQGITKELYFQITGTTEEDLHKQHEADAEKRTKTNLVIEAIAKAEGFEASEEEVEKEIAELAATYNMEVEQVKALLSADMLQHDIAVKKAVELVTSTASVK